MKLYCISGLGADERVFGFLKLNCELIPIPWINPLKNESLKDYSIRLFSPFDLNDSFGVLGVSFGGLVATEISKHYNPSITILISSAETKNELRPLFRIFGKTKLIKLIPTFLLDPPRCFAYYLFGTNKKQLLMGILNETDLSFSKWAISKLITWDNIDKLSNVIKISGSNDKLIPPVNGSNNQIIEGGEHFMIVDRADEVSEIINQRLAKYE